MADSMMRGPVARRVLAAAASFLLGSGPALAADGADLRVVTAARQRDAGAVRRLLAAGADAGATQADGATALHWAAYWNDVDLAVQLIRAGANVNAANDLGVTPLSLASTAEEPALALALLDAGANPNLPHARGTTPLMEAARAGRERTVTALLRYGAAVNAREATHDQTALMWAAAHRHAAVVQALAEAGADVGARSRVRRRKVFVKTSRGGSYDPGAFERHIEQGEIVEVEEGGYTALLFAAQQGDVASAAQLLAAGADVNDAAPIGMSALVVAAYSNHAEVGRYLLERGARADAAGAGYTALHAAILRGNVELVAALLAHGADVNARIAKPSGARRQSADYAFGDTLVGATPVYLAAKFAEIPILRALLDAGADARVALPDGSTPIMAALDTDRINSLGGEGLGKDRRDRNVFYRAYNTQSPEDAEDNVLEIVRLLGAAGADLDAADRAGDTVLHAAAQAGMNRVIQALVDQGAQLAVKNRKGQTPLRVAEAPRRNRGGDIFEGQTETAALLRRLGAVE